MSFISMIRYYTEKIRQSTNKRKLDAFTNSGYV
jgi:hypothetical protein